MYSIDNKIHTPHRKKRYILGATQAYTASVAKLPIRIRNDLVPSDLDGTPLGYSCVPLP